jgi:hypothetical protein
MDSYAHPPDTKEDKDGCQPAAKKLDKFMRDQTVLEKGENPLSSEEIPF